MNTYAANLTQTAENNPDVELLSPIVGNTIAWTRVAAGIYRGTPEHPFDHQRAQVFIGSNNGGRYLFNAFIDWEEQVGTVIVQTLLQYDGGAGIFDYTDSALYTTAIRIDQY